MPNNNTIDKGPETNSNINMNAKIKAGQKIETGINSRVVHTNTNSKNGQNKCPKCGATDISLNIKTGALRCNFCRHEFQPEKVEGLETDISQLQGEIIGSGAQDIAQDAEDIVTLKCSSCGAEVVIDTTQNTQARCHWCRNTLSINEQIPNGAVPDVVLPFNLTKAQAQEEINKFVSKRKFFAHPKFKAEFTTDNIMGVYFPYMLVDVNSHAKLTGHGEHEVRRYTRKSGDREITLYDADLYEVEREFDLTIDGLSIESNSDRLNKKSSNNTNNIINSIMPFDTENCVKYNANYLKGYTSEKRDMNIDQLRPIVDTQSKDIARYSANSTLKHYDRGVCWSSEQLDVKGRQWKTAYLPVWLYSYQQKKGNNSILHYVAVNARTKETMGSVPIHIPKLFAISCLVELLGLVAMLFFDDFEANWLFLLAGFVYFFIIYLRYRNSNARHHHEVETKNDISNLQTYDKLIKRETELSNPQIKGANNTYISGQNTSEVLSNTLNFFK